MAERNRRRYRRVQLKQVSTRLTADDGALHIGLAVENMSLGGCFVRCPTLLKVGTEVKLEIHRPGASQTINLLGRVVSTRAGAAPGMGIAFMPMPRDVSQRIEGLVGAVDPLAVRTLVVLPPQEARTDPAIPVLTRTPGPAASVELDELRAQVKSLEAQLKKRDHRVADLEAQVERLKQRLILYGGKL
ncbi:MAG: PilZ domain-containing protein [Myxococcales bacterium]|nr:PilZ domain-containing protein [Myxococcales bacterium]